jgi:hypothetical protein
VLSALQTGITTMIFGVSLIFPSLEFIQVGIFIMTNIGVIFIIHQ